MAGDAFQCSGGTEVPGDFQRESVATSDRKRIRPGVDLILIKVMM